MQTPSKPKGVRRKRLPAAARADMQRTRQVARHEMALGLMSMFRPLPDGAQRREVRIEQKFAGGLVRIMGVEMSQLEQGVFLALLAIAARGGSLKTALDAGLLPGLPHQNAPKDAKPEQNIAGAAQTIEIKTSLAELCRVAGLSDRPGSNTRESVRLAFQRLAMITVYAEGGNGAWGITHLIAGAIGRGDEAGSVVARLNPRSTAAALGGRSYAPISMPDYRSLPTPTARVLYAWLCSWFAGRTGARLIGLDKLEGHVFGAIAEDRRRRSERRAQIKRALEAIQNCGSQFNCAILGEQASITREFEPGVEPELLVRRAPDTDTPSAGQSPHEKNPVQVAATSSSSAVLRADRLHCSENQKDKKTGQTGEEFAT